MRNLIFWGLFPLALPQAIYVRRRAPRFAPPPCEPRGVVGAGDPLRVIRCQDENHEADQVVAEILDHKLRKRTRFGDYAILYRGNFQARVFEKMLRRLNATQFPVPAISLR